MVQDSVSHWEKLWNWLRSIPEAKALRIAIAGWLIFALVVAIIVAVQPNSHTATLEYQYASANWWKGVTLYQKKNGGYLYLPQYAILYTPYIVISNIVSQRVGEPLWRLTILFILAWSIWRAAGKLTMDRRALLFLVATLLLLPSAFSSSRNGQVNMPLGALYLLCAVNLSEKRWRMSAFLLVLSLALKPISIVPILLCGVLYASLRIPLLIGLLLLFLVAFIHPHPAYVWNQYHVFVATLLHAGKPTSNMWCDFAGMFRNLGMRLPDIVQLAIRSTAALVALWAAWKSRKIPDAFRAAYSILFIAVVYLMLFNPRTETNSYVMLGLFIALWGAYEGLIGRRLNIVAWVTALALFLGTENYGGWIFHATDLWAKAFATSILAAWLLLSIARTPPGMPVLVRPPLERN